MGIKPRWLPAADRNWFHRPRDRYIRFYTRAPLTIHMPLDELSGPYDKTWFFRIQEVLDAGGFQTVDLG